MKMLLFVQTGDARPKCAGGAVHFTRAGYRTGYNCKIASDPVMSALGDSKTAWGWWTTPGPWNALLDSDRWWLVECEDADAGRAIITHDALLHTSIGKAVEAVGPVVKSRDPNRVSEPVQGRILASGGRP